MTDGPTHAPFAPGPRSVRSRVTITTVLWVVLTAGPTVLADTLFRSPTAEGTGWSIDPGSTLAVLLPLPVFALLAPRVSYRWFDCLFLLIPFYSLVWSFKILWRAAYLPFRDWTPRPDEVARCDPPPDGSGGVYTLDPARG